jgi:L-threonylcarbamoyladenylate synthase
MLSVFEAGEALLAGDVVAVPTDTVYGLAASLGHPTAVARIFELKERPADVALPVMVANVDQIIDLGVSWSDEAASLASAFWPGALTIVVGADGKVAHRIGAADSLGFRIPNQPQLLELLHRTGPLAVTSANLHGESPCTSAEAVISTFAQTRLRGVLNGGMCDGAPSTVVSLTAPWRILRAGVIGERDLAPYLGPLTTK